MLSGEQTDSIVRRVTAGETECYADIVRTYQRSVWQTVLLAAGDLHTPEDLVQQTFVQAFRHLDQYRLGSNFRHWINRIARNIAFQELRRRAREDRRLRVYYEYLEEAADDRVSGERLEKLAAALQGCRGFLSEPASRALALRYEQAKGFEEIAGILGRTVAGTRQLLQRVRETLKKCIDDHPALA